MGIIFWLSSRTADESSAQSGIVLQWLTKIFKSDALSDFIVRKSAHCLEFAGLSFLCCNAFYHTEKKNMPLPAVLITSVYAVTDEVHQLFVDGRSCQISDWAIDTGGAVIGALAFTVLLALLRLICKRKKSRRLIEKNKFIDSADN